jgi:excinuclease ABC subunit A
LHFDDVLKLITVLNDLVNKGNTVVVIEHNLDVIKCADHVIDLGPEGGNEGGRIIATGTPEEIAKIPESHTGRFLKQRLSKSLGSMIQASVEQPPNQNKRRREKRKAN